jgi:hypothetical protein
MHAPRETMYAALFALGSGITWTPLTSSDPGQFNTTSRLLKGYGQVTAQPALFQLQAFEDASQTGSYGLTKWKARAKWIIYYKFGASSPASISSQVFNPMMDAIEKALQGQYPGQLQQLTAVSGGPLLAVNAYIDGRVVLCEGTEDGQAAVIVPITLDTGI